MIEDRWINFVLLNGWRIKAEVVEETGELTILVSNEKGNVNNGSYSHEAEEVKEVYRLIANEKESN
mgnify:CR=1 FL=1|tara:strand:+ start:470 stop:667 length:198 start_codon:yes stop_codon:yes gene_type:complete